MNKLFPLFALLAPIALATSFEGPTAFPFTTRIGVPTWMAAADMNRDGIQDLVAVHTAPLPIRTAVSIGIATVRAQGEPIIFEAPFSNEILDAALGDFTSDRATDLLVLDHSTFGPDRLCVAPGSGTGAFLDVICTSLPELGGRIAAGDFNGDGRVDAAVTHNLTSQVSLWYGRGDGTFTSGPAVPIPNPGILVAAEINGDGATDLVVHSRAGRLHFLVSAQNTPFRVQESRPASPTYADMTIADLNRDGRADILACDTGAGQYAVVFGSGTSAPFFGNPIVTETNSRPVVLLAADLNADSIPEVIVSTSAGMVLAQVSAAGVVSAPNSAAFAAPSATRPAALDLNGDRLVDLAAYGGMQGLSLSAYMARATATAVEVLSPPASASYGQRVVINARAMVNAAPFPDLPVTSGRFTLYRNNQVVQDIPAVGLPLADRASSDPRAAATGRFETALPLGDNEYTVMFQLANGYRTSSSLPFRVAVQTSASSVRLTSTETEIRRDQGLRLAAAVTTPGGPAIDGVVRVLVNDEQVASAPVVNGVAQPLIPAGLPLGKARVKLVFESPGYLASSTEELEFIVRGTLTAVNAATFRAPVAADSLATLSIVGFPAPAAAARVTAELRHASGDTFPAAVTYAGLNQVNVHLPAGPLGASNLHVLVDGVSLASSEVTLVPVAPGVFTVDSTPDGTPAATAALYAADGSSTPVPVFRCEGSRCVAEPMATGGAGESLVLTLYGTGWRNGSPVLVTIGGAASQVLFAGAHPNIPGLDQINVVVPKSLAGAGSVRLMVNATGIGSNSTGLIIR